MSTKNINRRKKFSNISVANSFKASSHIKPKSSKEGQFVYVKWSLLKIYSFVTIIATLLGLTAFSYFLPKVDVSVTQTLDDTNPFATLLEIHNTSEFDMSSIKLDMKGERIDIWNIKLKRDYMSFKESEFSAKSFEKTLIGDGEYWTTQIPFEPLVMIRATDIGLKYANIKLILKYRYLWRDVEKRFRLIGVSDNNGKVVWTRQPE